MSASQEKKNRNLQRSEDKPRKALSKEEEENLKYRRYTWIVIAVVVVLVAFAAVINSNFLYTSTTAVSVGTTNYSPAEVDVFYRSALNNIYTSYQQMFGDSASYFLNSITSDTVWPEAEENLRQVTALYDDAQSTGASLSQEDLDEIEEQLSSLSTTASSYGYSSVDHFLGTNYGKGVTEKVFRSVLERMYLAENRSEAQRDSFTYTQSDLDAYYDEHKDELDTFTYYAYTVSTSNTAFDELEEDEAKLSAAHDAAQVIADAAEENGVEGFTEAVQAFSEGTSVTPYNYAGSSVSSSYSEWLADSARESGDVTVVDTDSGAIAVLYISRDDGSYLPVSMRHILIGIEADENGEYTDEAKDAAEEEINRIYEEFLEDPTEDHFAELANEYSTDPGSNTNGGLYENIAKHQMVPEIDSFLFDEEAQVGDTKVVYVESSNYRGWHIVYFLGADGDELYRNSTIENLLRSNDYNAWIESLTENYTVVQKSGFRYVNME